MHHCLLVTLSLPLLQVGTNFSCLYFFIYAASHGIRPGVFAR